MMFLNAGVPEEREDNGNNKRHTTSPLRKRMKADMDLAGLASTTQKTYISVVAALQKATRCRPDHLTEEKVRRYLIWLREEKGVARGTFQTNFYGLKFFYVFTLGVDWALFLKKKFVCLIKSESLTPFPVMIAAT